MAKRVVGSPSVSSELDQFLKCLEHSRSVLGAPHSMIDASWEAIGVPRACGSAPPERSTDAAEQAVAQNSLLAADADTVGQFIDDLAAAYAAARETGDDVGLEVYGKALETIGRYLALQIGPKAAGIKLS